MIHAPPSGIIELNHTSVCLFNVWNKEINILLTTIYMAIN